MSSDAKHAHTITASIAQVAKAIKQFAADTASVSAQSVKDGCAAAIQTTREAVGHVSRKHHEHALLLVRPFEAACQLFGQASRATDEEARDRFILNAERAITITLEGAQALEKEIAPASVLGSIQDLGGSMEGIDFLGVTLGDDPSIVDTLTNTAKGVAKYVQDKRADDASSLSDSQKLAAAVAADQTATAAVAQSMASADIASRDSSKADAAEADKMFADSALTAEDRAGAALPASLQSKRLDAAQTALDAAQKKLAVALRGNNVGAKQIAQFTVQAAKQTLAKVQGASGGGGGTALTKPAADGGVDKENDGGGALAFATKKLGPLPRWAYAVLAAAGYGGYRALSKKGGR